MSSLIEHFAVIKQNEIRSCKSNVRKGRLETTKLLALYIKYLYMISFHNIYMVSMKEKKKNVSCCCILQSTDINLGKVDWPWHICICQHILVCNHISGAQDRLSLLQSASSRQVSRSQSDVIYVAPTPSLGWWNHLYRLQACVPDACLVNRS